MRKIQKNYVVLAVLVFGIAILVFASFNIDLVSRIFAKPVGYCEVLKNEHCDLGVIVKDPRAPDLNEVVALKLPEGTPIFSPVAGEYVSSSTFNFFVEPNNFDTATSYPGAIVYSKIDENSVRAYNFIFEGQKANIPESSQIEKGEIIGYTSGKTIDKVGSYNLIIYTTKSESSGIYNPDPTTINSLFTK